MMTIFLPRFPLSSRKLALLARVTDFDCLPFKCNRIEDAFTIDCEGRMMFWYNTISGTTKIVRED